MRARRTLVRATALAREKAKLARYFAKAMAGLLAERDLEELRQGRVQPAAVLFADIPRLSRGRRAQGAPRSGMAREHSARVALPFLANGDLGLVRAVKPCASRIALRLRGLTDRG